MKGTTPFRHVCQFCLYETRNNSLTSKRFHGLLFKRVWFQPVKFHKSSLFVLERTEPKIIGFKESSHRVC